MWCKGTIPQEYKDASIIHLYKRKGNRNICDNHRGISLLVIAGKILARVILNRFTDHISEAFLPDSQCGFRKGRGTNDMIFAARQLQEKCREQNMDLYFAFVDLTKAFDTVSREGLWKLLAKLGCPDKFISMIQQFHDGMMAKVSQDGDVSSAFLVSNGVKQGCVLASTLFSVLFAAMLLYAFRNLDTGIYIRFRTDGKLFNLRRLQAKSKVFEALVRELLFADDCALAAHTQEDLQLIMNQFAEACKLFGLTISLKKTEVMHQPKPGKPYVAPVITIDGYTLKAVDKFTYLGSTLSRDAIIDDEIALRLAKASTSFGRLRAKLWDKRGITIPTKLQVYRAVVISSLLYACESWTTYSRHIRKINHFHLSCLRKIMKIRWQDKIPDTEVLKQANMPSIGCMVMKAQLRWTGHLVRMPDERIPKKLLYSELKLGRRTQGGQFKRFKDTIKANLKKCGIPVNNWEGLARNRTEWRKAVYDGTEAYEAKCIQEAERKRAQRKSRKPQQTTITDFQCPVCHRYFQAKIGLYSHLRVHRTTNTS